jgi:hypothetical protein
MAMNFKVKNTFLELEGEFSKPTSETRRSSSVPRVFKPAGANDLGSSSSPRSVDSTNASEKDSLERCPSFCSDTDYQDTSSTCSDYTASPSVSSNGAASVKESSFDHDDIQNASHESSKVTLSLSDMVGNATKKKKEISLVECCASRSRLRSRAQPFQSKREPPSEVKTLISHAEQAFRSVREVVDVQVQSGGMGGTTMIDAEFQGVAPDASLIFPLVKDAVLNAAAHSENTYVMGYNARPFNDLDALSFSMNIGCVPHAHQNTACWDTYENGICPRKCNCRWDHPAALDMMRVIVTLKARQSF